MSLHTQSMDMCSAEPWYAMPYYPTIETEHGGNIIVWWFPSDFSQSKLGGTYTGSNACTIIVLLVASHCHKKGTRILTLGDSVCQDIVDALGECIVYGNEIYSHLLSQGRLQNVNLSVPEAIEAAGSALTLICEWKSLVFLLDLRETLFERLKESAEEWYSNIPTQSDSDLFVILIAESRSILFVFQQDIDRVTLVDSHQHQNRGAVIAQVTFVHLFTLCAWYNHIMETCYGARPQFYELSFLYFRRNHGEYVLH